MDTEHFIPLFLQWSHYPGVRTWSWIRPKLYKYFSLGYVIESKNVKSPIDEQNPVIIRKKSNVLFVLDTDVKPFSGEYILYPNTHYKITVEISAKNLKARTESFSLYVKDKWPKNEKEAFEKYISCELLPHNSK